MIEWSRRNEYNPMNSHIKGATYYEHYKKILGWMDGKNTLPAPVEASLDPTSACNNRCYYCSSNRYLNEQGHTWDDKYLTDLICDLHNWGVKGLCWGGRESTLNPNLADANRLAAGKGMETAIVTNGTHLPDKLMESLLLCKWIGVSVDTTDPAIYKDVRGTDDCGTVWYNIFKLGRMKKNTVLGVRALILPETVWTLHSVVERAREAKANFVHIRPADLERKDLPLDPVRDNPLLIIGGNKALESLHKFETPDFGVFTVTHKFTEDLRAKHNFKRCLASPLAIQICSDKKQYICVDHRMDPRFEVKGEWGSKEHLDLINGIDPMTECSRCTYAAYNQQMAELVIEDRCHVNFP